MNIKKVVSSVVSAVAVCCLFSSVNANAGVIKSWELTNKTPGALGLNYGLRLNNLASSVGHDIMIFDFEAAGQGVTLDLFDTGSDLELRLFGTAFGAEYVSSPKQYGSALAGTYELEFTWKGVEINVNGFDYIADNGLGSYAIGDGQGTVKGVTSGTAFTGANELDLYAFSGKYDYTLDVKFASNPDASGWLSYGKGHAGDYSFNMVEVPEPGSLALLVIGSLGLLVQRKLKPQTY